MITKSFKLLAVLLVFSTISYAQSPKATYKYDELGRVIEVSYENGDEIDFAYDPADNRTTVTTIQGEPRIASQKIIVVPLNGFTVIPVD